MVETCYHCGSDEQGDRFGGAIICPRCNLPKYRQLTLQQKNRWARHIKKYKHQHWSAVEGEKDTMTDANVEDAINGLFADKLKTVDACVSGARYEGAV